MDSEFLYISVTLFVTVDITKFSVRHTWSVSSTS